MKSRFNSNNIRDIFVIILLVTFVLELLAGDLGLSDGIVRVTKILHGIALGGYGVMLFLSHNRKE